MRRNTQILYICTTMGHLSKQLPKEINVCYILPEYGDIRVTLKAFIGYREWAITHNAHNGLIATFYMVLNKADTAFVYASPSNDPTYVQRMIKRLPYMEDIYPKLNQQIWNELKAAGIELRRYFPFD